MKGYEITLTITIPSEEEINKENALEVIRQVMQARCHDLDELVDDVKVKVSDWEF